MVPEKSLGKNQAVKAPPWPISKWVSRLNWNRTICKCSACLSCIRWRSWPTRWKFQVLAFSVICLARQKMAPKGRYCTSSNCYCMLCIRVSSCIDPEWLGWHLCWSECKLKRVAWGETESMWRTIAKKELLTKRKNRLGQLMKSM